MRPSINEQCLAIAAVVASRATCARRSVGCVLVNIYGEILSTGYNGRQAGAPHCNDGRPCAGAKLASGTGLDECEALHAEWNALLKCSSPRSIYYCFVTTAPCVTCTKMLLNTGCRSIYFINPYPTSGERLWVDNGRDWVKVWFDEATWLGRVVGATGLIPQP